MSEDQFSNPDINATLFGDDNYPSVIAFELSAGLSIVYLGILVLFGYQGGPDFKLHGLFESKAEFEKSLSEHGFVETSSRLRGSDLDDETILSLWRYS